MSERLKLLLQSIGALSELLGIMRDEFIKNGFTREEAVYLIGVILESVVKNSKSSGELNKPGGEPKGGAG